MQRDKTIDIAKGIAIFLVIVGHQGDIGMLSHFIYTFHMPLFFILAGYFFKEKDVATTFKSSWKRLVNPYLFSCALYLLWYIAFGMKYHSLDMITRAFRCAMWGSGAYHGDVIWGQLPTIGMIWFLLALFWSRVVYNAIVKIIPKYKYIIGGLLAVVATVVNNYVIDLPCAILPGLSAIMFFMLGSFLREHQTVIVEKQKTLVPIGLVCWIIAIVCSQTNMVSCHYGCYPLDVIGACGGTWVVYQLSRLINSKGGKVSTFLTWAGVNSMSILCAHFLEQSTFVWQHVHIPEDWYIILPIKFMYVVCFTLFAYKIPYMRSLLRIKKYGE